MGKNKFAKQLKYSANKLKNAKWFLPGWVFYEYYKVHKAKGDSKNRSIGQGAKAEAIRLAALASLPIPGTYELTTTGLALLKNKIEKGELERLTLKAFRDFRPKVIRSFNKKGKPYLRIFYKEKKLYFEIFYKEKKFNRK